MGRTIPILPVVLLLASGAVPAATPPEVVVARASVVDFPLAVEALGNAKANEAVDVRPKITSTVTAIHLREGQRVEAGEVLVELENTEALAQVAAARAALVDSESQFRRTQELYRTRAVSESQVQQLEARRDADRAAVAAAEARLADTVIRAPFAGRVGLRRISVGSLVDPGSVITTLDDTATIKLDFDVPETFISRLQTGLRVTARSVAWPDQEFAGSVSSVDTRVDPISRTLTVRALIDNRDGYLRPGMFLTVALVKDDVRALTIPEQAVVPERSKQQVFVVGDGDIVELREIETGRRRPGEVEVLAGLSSGERVIVEGTQKARPGLPVTVRETTPGGPDP